MDSKRLTAERLASDIVAFLWNEGVLEPMKPYQDEGIKQHISSMVQRACLADLAALERRVADQRKCIGELTRTGVSLLNQRDALQREVERMKEAAAKALAAEAAHG